MLTALKKNISEAFRNSRANQILNDVYKKTRSIEYATNKISADLRKAKADSSRNIDYRLIQNYSSVKINNLMELKSFRKEILKTITESKIIDTIMSQSDSIYSLIASVTKTNNKLDSISDQIKELEEENLKSIDNEYQQTYLFISVFGTRIGAVLILIFLVQLLIRIYRYNIRLSSYFNARADALRMIEENKELKFTDIINSLSPDNYDIGSAPKSPAVEVTELLKLFLSTKK